MVSWGHVQGETPPLLTAEVGSSSVIGYSDDVFISFFNTTLQYFFSVREAGKSVL